MRADRYTYFFDANALAGSIPRSYVLNFNAAGFYRARYSDRVLGEVERYIADKINDPQKARLQRERIANYEPDNIVTGYEPLMAGLELPDPDDVHVLAAAIATRASTLVTDNVKDSPPEILDPLDIEVKTLDDMLADTIDRYQSEAAAVVRCMRADMRKSMPTAEDLIAETSRIGLETTAFELARYSALI